MTQEGGSLKGNAELDRALYGTQTLPKEKSTRNDTGSEFG